MEFDWTLLQKASEEKKRIEREFRRHFFEKKDSYFEDSDVEVEISATEVIITTNYNSYKLRRKQNGSFVMKKDKLEQYFYAIDASYTIDTWQKGLVAAREDFEEIIAIKDEMCSWLEENSKFTFADNVKRFYVSMFGKKEETPSIELKDEPAPKDNEEKPVEEARTEETEKSESEQEPMDANEEENPPKEDEKIEKKDESEKKSKPQNEKE